MSGRKAAYRFGWFATRPLRYLATDGIDDTRCVLTRNLRQTPIGPPSDLGQPELSFSTLVLGRLRPSSSVNAAMQNYVSIREHTSPKISVF